MTELNELIERLREEINQAVLSRDPANAYNTLERIRLKTRTDSLTGLGNDSGLDSLLNELGSNSAGIGIAALDIKGLKHVNDTYGRDQGDNLIVLASDYLRNSIRTKETARNRDIFRAGNKADEFYIVSTLINEDQERSFMERLISQASNHYLEIVNNDTKIKVPLVFAYGYSVNNGQEPLIETRRKAYSMLNRIKAELKSK